MEVFNTSMRGSQKKKAKAPSKALPHLPNNLTATQLVTLFSKPNDRRKTSIALSASILEEFKAAIGTSECASMLEILMDSFTKSIAKDARR